eukprot:403370452
MILNKITIILVSYLLVSVFTQETTVVVNDSSEQQPQSQNSQQQSQPLTSADFTPTNAPVGCQSNDDCIDTTFCCSTYSCVHPNICLYGSKLQDDVCDYNFECMSRCCDNSNHRCAHFQKCFSSCSVNNDCTSTSKCCSQGQCTDKVVCDGGNKVKGDYCERSTECISKVCSSNVCVEAGAPFPKKIVFSIIVIIIFIIGGSFLFYYILTCLKSSNRSRQNSQGRTDSKGSYSQNLMDSSGDSQGYLMKDRDGKNYEKGLNSGQFKQLWKKGNLHMPFDRKYNALPIYEQSKEYYTSDSQNFFNRSNYDSSQYVAGLNSMDQSHVHRQSVIHNALDDDSKLETPINTSPDVINLKKDKKSLTTRFNRRPSDVQQYQHYLTEQMMISDFEMAAKKLGGLHQKSGLTQRHSNSQLNLHRASTSVSGNIVFRSISPRHRGNGGGMSGLTGAYENTHRTAQVVQEQFEDTNSSKSKNSSVSETNNINVTGIPIFERKNSKNESDRSGSSDKKKL